MYFNSIPIDIASYNVIKIIPGNEATFLVCMYNKYIVRYVLIKLK